MFPTGFPSSSYSGYIYTRCPLHLAWIQTLMQGTYVDTLIHLLRLLHPYQAALLCRHPLYLSLGLEHPHTTLLSLLTFSASFWASDTSWPSCQLPARMNTLYSSHSHWTIWEAWLISLRLSNLCQVTLLWLRLLCRHHPSLTGSHTLGQDDPSPFPHFSACLAQPYLLPSNCTAQEGRGKGMKAISEIFLFLFFGLFYAFVFLF